MATVAATTRTASIDTISTSYERFAGIAAILAGVVGFIYSIAFVVLRQPLLYSLCLLIIGLITIAVMVALYQRLRDADPSFALLGLLLGLSGALGTAVHGGFDLALAIRPVSTITDLPNGIDPRGLMTFGVAGLALWVFAWLMTRPASTLPKAMGYLGYAAAALLIVLYLARLIVLDPTSPLVLVPALLVGFIASPVFYIWLGLTLWRNR